MANLNNYSHHRRHHHYHYHHNNHKPINHSIIVTILSSLLLLSILVLNQSHTAIAQQQHQQLSPVSSSSSSSSSSINSGSNTLTAKLLNKHPFDQNNNNNNNYNRDIIGVHNLNGGQSSNHQLVAPPSNGLLSSLPQPSSSRDIVMHHQRMATGGDYTKAINQQLLDLRQALITRSFKFDENFRNLLSTSKRGLHMMFTSTYGVMYEQNTEIFTGLYESLEQFYDNGQINLTKSMREFFANLYKRVFTVYNTNKKFTDEYLECVSERLTEMKPFKDVPDKLIESISYTFVAARTFLKSLNEGIDVIKHVISLGQPPQCTNLIQEKLIKSQQQANSNRQPPCILFCEQVMARCIGKDNLDQMNEKWRAYVVSLTELAVKLSTSYNIETIIEPLDVQISEAIMNFQENAPNITEGVYRICGGPVSVSSQTLHGSSRQSSRLSTNNNRLIRRSANPGIGEPDYQGRSRGYLQHSSPPAQFTRGTVLDNHYKFTGLDNLAQEFGHRTIDHVSRIDHKSSTLIDEIKKFAASSKSFWSSLPTSVCTSVLGSNTSALVSNALQASNKKQTPNCYSEHFSITDINTDIRYRTEILKQADHLQLVRSKIDDALRGEEVDWSTSHEQQLPQQHQQQQQQHHQRIPAVSNSIGGISRIPSPTITSTTSASPSDPATDDEESTDDYDQVESGSGDDENCSEEDPEGCSDSGSDQETSEPSTDDYGISSTPATIEKPPTKIPDPIEGNGLSEQDMTPSQTILQDDFRLITAQNEAGFQKSGQTSYKLVINFEVQIMLSLIMSVALLFVTNFSTRSRTYYI